MDLNKVAANVAKREKGKKQLNIAEVKTVIRHFSNLVKEKTAIDLKKVLGKVK